MRQLLIAVTFLVPVAMSTGCSISFDVSKDLPFAARERKADVSVALYVSPDAQAYEWEGQDELDTRVHGPVGKALAPNAERVLRQVFQRVEVVAEPTSSAAQAVVHIRPGRATYRWWKEGISYCRRFGQEIVADVYSPSGQLLFTVSSDIQASSRRYKVTIDNETTGEGDAIILAKILYLGPAVTSAGSVPRIFSTAINGVLERNLACVSEQVAARLQSTRRETAADRRDTD